MKVVVIILISFLGVDPASPGAIQAQRGAPQIELSESRPLRVAYIEHSGPYWSLGPVIDRVARDARSFAIGSNLLIRYVDDQAGSLSNSVHAHVGFEIAVTERPPPPYQIAQWPIVLAARKTVHGPDGLSLRHLTSIRAWARSQNLDQGGDMMAIVKLAEDGESTAIEQADILLPVCVPDMPAPKPQVTKNSEGEKAEELAVSRPASRITRVIQLPLPEQVRRDNTEKGEDDSHAPSPTLAEEAAARLAANRKSRSDVSVPSSSQELGSPLPATAPVRPRSSEIPVRELIESGDFASLAAALLPEQPRPAGHSWGDQIAARIVAIAGALHKSSPTEEGWLDAFATQLAARREAAKAASAKSARVIGQTVPIYNTRDTDRKAVMLEFDRLMTQVSYQALTPAQIREKVADLLEEAIPLVSP